MKSNYSSLFFYLYSILILSGCAIGNVHRYQDASADLNVKGDIAVAVGTKDHREYILSRNKNPTFSGLTRGGFGNPFSVTTESGKPLAEAISLSISQSLSKNGFDAKVVIIGLDDNNKLAINKLKSTGVKRIVFLKINEWKSDTYTNTSLIYDLHLRILDESGKTLAQKQVKGNDNLGGSAWNPPGHAKDAVPQAFKQKMEELFNDNKIINALK